MNIAKGNISAHLDMIRALAAISVLAAHVRSLFFVDYKNVLHASVMQKVFFLLTGFGHQAVIIFFVLSGYFISASILRAIQSNYWNWGWYLSNRLTRLYIVLIPALILCAFWDKLGLSLFGATGIYGSMSDIHVNSFPVISRLNYAHFFGNAFFLQEIITQPFGSDGPLWSLSYEFWYYLAFPLFWLTALPSIKPALRLGYCLLGVSILVLVGHAISTYFAIWLLGVVVLKARLLPYFQHHHRRTSFFVASTGCLFLFTLLYTRFLKVDNFLTDFIVALTFAVFVYALQHLKINSYEGQYYKLSKRLSGFSYTLYLVHLPLLVFFAAGVNTHWQPDLLHIGIGSLIGALVLAYAFALSVFTEAKTDTVRRKIAALMKGPAAVSP